MTLLSQRIDTARLHRLRLVSPSCNRNHALTTVVFPAVHHRCFVFYSPAKFDALSYSVLMRYRVNQP